MDIASLVVGAVIGAVPSWFISKYFANKSSKELEDSLKKQSAKTESATTFNSFERMLRTSEWKKEHVGMDEIWICEQNRLFQIHRCNDDREFKEDWTSRFPDQNTTLFHFHLMINGTVVKAIPFICADGGRYTLPLPELEIVDGNPTFCWSPNSVEVKISEIIGNFYRCNSIKEVADFLDIDLHTVTDHA